MTLYFRKIDLVLGCSFIRVRSSDVEWARKFASELVGDGWERVGFFTYVLRYPG